MDHPPVSTPKWINFEITSKCNFACAYCYASDKKKDMTIDEIRQYLVPQLVNMGTIEHFDFIGGEPTLRFDDVIAIAPDIKKTGASAIGFSTNGYLLTGKMIDRFAAEYSFASYILFTISIDSLDPEVMLKTRPPHTDALERALRAVDDVLARKDLFVSVETVASSININELPRIIEYVKSKGPRCVMSIFPCMQTGRGRKDQSLRLTVEQSREVDRLRMKHVGHPVFPCDLSPFPCDPKAWKCMERDYFDLGFTKGCSAGREYCNIDSEGNFSPCSYISVVLGNVKDSPVAIRDAWANHPIINRLQARDVGGKCRTCKYHDTCGGCRSRALTETGDLFGDVPSCEGGGPDGHPCGKEFTRAMKQVYVEIKILHFFHETRKKLQGIMTRKEAM